MKILLQLQQGTRDNNHYSMCIMYIYNEEQFVTDKSA